MSRNVNIITTQASVVDTTENYDIFLDQLVNGALTHIKPVTTISKDTTTATRPSNSDDPMRDKRMQEEYRHLLTPNQQLVEELLRHEQSCAAAEQNVTHSSGQPDGEHRRAAHGIEESGNQNHQFVSATEMAIDYLQ